MSEHCHCPVCGSDDVEMMGAYRGVHPVFTDLKRVRCGLCGLVFASPLPAEVSVNDYNASYFSSAHGGQPREPFAMAFFSGIANLRLAHVQRYLDDRKITVSNILEFGPGPGFFARHWLARYPHAYYKACETDSSCHESLQKLGVHLVETSALVADSAPVDLVVISHVLEHVSDPLQFLKDATRNLRKEGVLFIEVPCRDWEYKPIDEPHLLFFDKGPLRQLLRSLRFEDIHVSYHGQEIEQLCSASGLRSILMTIRSKLISLGLVAPFARNRPGLEVLSDPLERAAVAPFQAHCETEKPSWWLRAMARKTQ